MDPDVVVPAKGLGGGMPIGATIAFAPAADLLTPGQHGSTFGGNPVACAAGLAVLETIESENLLAHVARQGERLRHGIRALGHPRMAEVGGRGCCSASPSPNRSRRAYSGRPRRRAYSSTRPGRRPYGSPPR